MKKVVCLICCLACLLCACNVSVDGYENFSKMTSDYELNLYLLPSEDFSTQFEYVDIDYHFSEKHISLIEMYEESLIVIAYDEAEYEQAKKYCLENMQLSKTNTIEFGNYLFIENDALFVGEHGEEKLNAFPHWFNMFAYNDALKRLVFMGFYGSAYTTDDAQSIVDNWEEFLETYFSVYDWTTEEASQAA